LLLPFWPTPGKFGIENGLTILGLNRHEQYTGVDENPGREDCPIMDRVSGAEQKSRGLMEGCGERCTNHVNAVVSSDAG
jgi:hypothetical protein